jgi:cob(I)alamin adenosyltransferase
MKIYTKKGDLGETSLLGGERVRKDHLRIDAYGTVDELNAQIGIVICQFGSAQDQLKTIQDQLFHVGSHLANSSKSNFKLEPIPDSWITDLEEWIDAKTKALPELKNFVLPGSGLANANCHVARCVCRRAERIVVALSQHESQNVDANIITYLNRLSDYLFTLSRHITHSNKEEEIVWQSR